MLDEKEFIQVEVDPGGKTPFLTANEIENNFPHLNTDYGVEY